jgi:hypothetical protein
MSRLLAELDKQRTTESSIPLRHVIDEWLRVAELEGSTRGMAGPRPHLGVKAHGSWLGEVNGMRRWPQSVHTLYSPAHCVLSELWPPLRMFQTLFPAES